jgi:ribosome-binding factor A
MSSRRQKKICRVIREAASDIIQHRLNDPRIEGIVSVTDVDVSPDMKNANVYLSVMAVDEKVAEKTIKAISRAAGYIQTEVGRRMTTKFYPKLTIHEDKKMKKTLEMMKLIDEASKELREIDAKRQEQQDIENESGDEEL